MEETARPERGSEHWVVRVARSVARFLVHGVVAYGETNATLQAASSEAPPPRPPAETAPPPGFVPLRMSKRQLRKWGRLIGNIRPEDFDEHS